MVEPRLVMPVVEGSSPFIHPSLSSIHRYQAGPLAQLVEQLTLNQRVDGSDPSRPTIQSIDV